jgi:SAM-dependent methyltransferase
VHGNQEDRDLIMFRILKLIRAFGGLPVARRLNAGLRRLTAFFHHLQFALEWQTGSIPNWFDHNIDLYYQWPKTGNSLGIERGVFSLLAMRPQAHVLELCCGDGFYTWHFFSARAASVLAVDIDPSVIESAQRNYRRDNVEFRVVDIVKNMPEGTYDNIVWDSALEYFEAAEINVLMKQISQRLAPDGVLSGHVIIQEKFNEGQKFAFRSKSDLLAFMEPCFAHVRTFESIHEGRRNLYFYAGMSALPFDNTWNPDK